MSNRTRLVLATIVTLVPGIAFAASLDSITALINQITTLVGSTIPKLIFALALAYFLYGVFSYVATGSDEKKRTEARNTIVYGIIILFVMSSVWGLVALIQTSTGIRPEGAPNFPTV